MKIIVAGPRQRGMCSLPLYFILQKDYRLPEMIQKYIYNKRVDLVIKGSVLDQGERLLVPRKSVKWQI